MKVHFCSLSEPNARIIGSLRVSHQLSMVLADISDSVLEQDRCVQAEITKSAFGALLPRVHW